MTKTYKATAILVVLLLLSTAAFAAKAKPTKKTTSKSTTNHATIGTTQLKGEYADLGSTYTLGKISPLNVTLTSVEFSVGQLVIGDSLHYPKADEKFLVLHYVIHNPQSQEVFVRWDTFNITAVDSKNENHEYEQNSGVEKTNSNFEMDLKPGQKISVFSYIAVPAELDIPKLIFKSDDNLVLRYNLKGKIKPLSAPYADPADSTGATALKKVTAKTGEFYPIGVFNFALNSTSFSNKEIEDFELEEGNRYFVINATIKNLAPCESYIRWDTLVPTLSDSDGVDLDSYRAMLLASRDKPVDTDLKPGQEVKVRLFFEVPSDIVLKTLSVGVEDSRLFEYDMNGVN